MAVLKTIVGLIGIVLIVNDLRVRQLFFKKKKKEELDRNMFKININPSAEFMISKTVSKMLMKKRILFIIFNRRLQLVTIAQTTKEDQIILPHAR